jgi:O-antigen chain-terminating methyltransferase
MVTDDFYRALEDRFRGSRDLIKARQKVYLPVVEAILKQVPKTLLDVGCGRAEWLELLTERGLNATGIDLNDEFVLTGRQAGLSVTKGEAIEFLSQQADQTYGLVSAFHVVEHLGFGKLLVFLKEAYRVLDNGGAVLIETFNPANLLVGALHLDVNQARGCLIPPVLLSFAAKFSGFESVVVVPEALENPKSPVSYTVIAFKNGGNTSIPVAHSLVAEPDLPISQKQMKDVHALFALVLAAETEQAPRSAMPEVAAYHLAQMKLRALKSEAGARDSQRSEEDAQRRVKVLQSQIDLLQARLHAAGNRAAAAEAAAKSLEEQVNAILTSTSWKLSSPVRVVRTAGRKVGVVPSVANRTLKLGLLHAVAYVRARPVLRQRAANTLARFPRVRARLVRLIGYRALQGVVSGSPLPAVESVDQMTARARAIYHDLLNAKSDGTQ